MKRPLFYRLDPDTHEPIPCDDLVEVGRHMPTQESWRVAATDLSPDVWVSTVFLPIDHNFMGDGPPVLFETMVFVRGEAAEYQRRYSSWDEAVRGHEEIVEHMRRKLEDVA